MAWAAYADAANVTVRDFYGVAVVYTPKSTLVAESIRMPLDRRWIEAGSAESPGTDLASVLDIRLADLSVAPLQGDTLTVDSIGFRVEDVQTTGNGDAKLILKRT
jgi:hypothetical protein